jgi:hypothetical protein
MPSWWRQMVVPAFDPAFLRFDAAALLKELSAAVAQQTSSSEACVYVEIKSIGALKPEAMTPAFCEVMESRAGSWGWNGNTFG